MRLTRRSFLKSSAAGLVAAGLRGSRAGAAPPGVLDRLGVAWYTVRDEMTADAAGTLKAIADLGYRYLESALRPSLQAAVEARRQDRVRADGRPDWDAWWDIAAADPLIADAVAERRAHFGGGNHPAEFDPPSAWLGPGPALREHGGGARRPRAVRGPALGDRGEPDRPPVPPRLGARGVGRPRACYLLTTFQE